MGQATGRKKWEYGPRTAASSMDRSCQTRASAVSRSLAVRLAARPPARALSVFDRACNLVDESGLLTTLAWASVGLGPFSMLVPEGTPFRPLVRASDPVEATPGLLRVGTLSVDWREARPWDPRPDWESLRRSGAVDPRWTGLLLAFAAGVHDHPASCGPGATWRGPGVGPSSFNPGAPAPGPPDPPPSPYGPLARPERLGLLALFRATEPAPPGPARAHDRFLEVARVAATELRRGFEARDAEAVARGAAGLAGLGPGATPAGDDFLVGALLRARLDGLDEALCRAARDAAVRRTTPLGAAWIAAAAEGECHASWHRLLGAMAAGDRPAVAAAARELLSHGATSGADALAGWLWPAGACPAG